MILFIIGEKIGYISPTLEIYFFTFYFVYFQLITLGAVQEVSHTSIFFFPRQEGAAAQNTTNAGTLKFYDNLLSLFHEYFLFLFLTYIIRDFFYCFFFFFIFPANLTNGKATEDRCRALGMCEHLHFHTICATYKGEHLECVNTCFSTQYVQHRKASTRNL